MKGAKGRGWESRLICDYMLEACGLNDELNIRFENLLRSEIGHCRIRSLMLALRSDVEKPCENDDVHTVHIRLNPGLALKRVKRLFLCAIGKVAFVRSITFP